jgi:hypothetical protein
MEYEVYLLDETMQLCHKGKAILATDNLAVACSYCYDYYNKHKIPICVFQPRHNSYREHYAPWLNQEEEDMALPRSIRMTRDGGRFWPAMLFRYSFTAVVIGPVFIAVVLGVINPLWFRDRFFGWVETTVNKITQWRNYRTYAIYLGADPHMWHTLKDQE